MLMWKGADKFSQFAARKKPSAGLEIADGMTTVPLDTWICRHSCEGTLQIASYPYIPTDFLLELLLQMPNNPKMLSVTLPENFFSPPYFSRTHHVNHGRKGPWRHPKERNITVESRGLDADASASRRASVSGATGPGRLAEFSAESMMFFLINKDVEHN